MRPHIDKNLRLLFVLSHFDFKPEADKSQKSKNTTQDPNSATLYATHGLRWAAMARLPYWNPTLMVIDPQHSICEGIPIELMEKAFKLENIAEAETASTCG
jgi:hypothetical protein